MRGAHLAVINQTMARQFWPNGNAIGQQIRIPNLKDQPPYSPAAPSPTAGSRSSASSPTRSTTACAIPSSPAVYVPYTLQMRMFTQILVRTKVPPLSILHDIRAQIVQIDPEQQVMTVRDLESWIKNEDVYSQQRFIATLFGVFAVLALDSRCRRPLQRRPLGVATRTNEFGIRMALGAKAGGRIPPRPLLHGQQSAPASPSASSSASPSANSPPAGSTKPPATPSSSPA